MIGLEVTDGISLPNMSNIDVDNIAGPGTEIVIDNATDGFNGLRANFRMTNITNGTIENLDMSGGANDAITISNGSNISILNNDMSGHRRTVVATNTAGLTIMDNNLRNTGLSNQFSLTLSGVTGLSASGNDWTGSRDGISLANMSDIDSILTMHGKVVKTRITKGQVDVHDLVNGTYILRSSDGRIVRFVKI